MGAANERGVELIDLARGVVERTRHIRADGAAAGRPAGRGVRASAASATLLCAFSITGHSSAPALASLPVAGVLATPAAVLAQGNPIRVVALALVGLVVAMLALLACEGDRDSNVSAGHVRNPCVVVDKTALGEEKPRPGARCKQSSAL